VEGLVAADADWAAAAAEARGLIAASARIVGTLDRVPANVIPKAAPARAASRRWVWRAAAVLALMAGSAVVLKRETPELPVLGHADSTVGAVVAPDAKQQQQQQPQQLLQKQSPLGRDAKVAAAKKNPEHKSELADAKPAEPARDKDVAASTGDLNANVAGAERRAANAPMAATAQSLPKAAPAAPGLATEKFTRLQPSCFDQHEPPDSAAHTIRLSAAALADSIRLEIFVLRGDTLAAVNGRLRAVRVPCSAP
jgi:hypothetical protein